MDGSIEQDWEKCRDIIYSDDYAAMIIEISGGLELAQARFGAECLQRITNNYAIIYIRIGEIEKISIKQYGYRTIPKAFGLLDTSSMEASGVLKLQRQSYINLLGRGIIIGFVDTGIDYTNPLFQNADQTTRILSIWDQEQRKGPPPEGLIYGTEYSREQINEALQSENPWEVVPSRDEVGHGTFMAGIAAGNQEEDFTGAAPLADLVVVKLKGAKKILREFERIQEDAICYAENDVIIGVRYLLDMSFRYNKPLVICLGVGTNAGDHNGSSFLARYLSDVGRNVGVAVVAAAGNEGNARHHYQSGVVSLGQSEDVDINVGQNEFGFMLELWATIPNLFSVGLISPGGEFISKIPARLGESATIRFLLEETIVYIDYQIVEVDTGDELILLRFTRPTQGIWKIRVYNESDFGGRYNMWLPLTGFITPNTFFINSSPNVTICEPANAINVITSATYNHQNDSLDRNSSRGYTRSGSVKPDITAPGVEVYGPGLEGKYEKKTGSSIAAAHTAGVAALLLEWGIVQRNDPDMDSRTVNKYIIRGARRTEMVYPNPEWGYGILDIYKTFESLRRTL